MNKILQKIGRWLQCYVMHNHEFTCDAQEGVKPDPDKIKGMDWLKHYEDYTRMYCKHCPKVVKGSILQ